MVQERAKDRYLQVVLLLQRNLGCWWIPRKVRLVWFIHKRNHNLEQLKRLG